MKDHTNRRAFLKTAVTAGMALQAFPLTFASDPFRIKANPLVGIQIAPFSFFDEGMENCLDILQQAGINALFCYSQTYHQSYDKPLNVFADHGFPIKGFQGRKLPHLWVKTHAQFYKKSILGHEQPNRDLEFHDRDFFKEILEPARRRGIKVYARILEASANRKELIPNYERVLTKDIFGHPGRGPCWNHPDYRAWLTGTVRDLISHYELTGFQYGAERTGPLSYLLNRGLVPTCFCIHCIRRNRKKGIDTDRAKIGYTQLYNFIKEVEKGTIPIDGVLAGIYGYLQQYPEILAWNYQWFQADNEIHQEIYSAAKAIKPSLEIGRHVDHQRSSWDIWYRAAVPYSDMADSADFVKPIVYHDILGPRLKHWVIGEMQQRVSHDLTEEEALKQFYAYFGHDATRMPSWEALDTQGLGAAYVSRETKRCVDGLAGKAKVYTGLGVDVPWHLPEGGMAPFPSPPGILKDAVKAAFSAGAEGLLISREYEEIRLESLQVIGETVKEIINKN